MQSDDIKGSLDTNIKLLEHFRISAQGKGYDGSSFAIYQRHLQIVATLEGAYQTTLLRELLEKKIINILPSPENSGRLFKE